MNERRSQVKLHWYTRTEILGGKNSFPLYQRKWLARKKKNLEGCVCECVFVSDLYVSGLVFVTPNKLDYFNDNRYECNSILFNSDAILRTYKHWYHNTAKIWNFKEEKSTAYFKSHSKYGALIRSL